MSRYSKIRDCAKCGKKKSTARKNNKYCYRCERLVKKERSAAQHSRHVQKVYQLQPGDYERLLEHQGGVCAICQRAKGISKRLAVDHDHKIEHLGRQSVRMLLCTFCNHEVLGRLGDEPENYERIANLLRNPPARELFSD